MEIKPLGHSSFRLSTRGVSLVTDPFDPAFIGLPYPKVDADIVTISHSHEDHNDVRRINGTPLVFSGPGEYESKDVYIKGIASYHDDKEGADKGKNTIFHIDMDGILIVHLGDLGHKLTSVQEEVLEDVDILLIPTGGFYTIDAKTAAAIVTKLEPSIVIPMHYKRAGLTPSIAEKMDEVSVFLKEMGKENAAPLPKLVITKDKLPEELQVVVLE